MHQDETREGLGRSGATGGGYILSKGVVSKVEVLARSRRPIIETSVNGDTRYDARTTRRALALLMRAGGQCWRLKVEQRVDVPIGCGFGASAASALSAALAASAALDSDLAKKDIARFAHDAEIIERTGLGTVSAVYDAVGAGFIYKPGAPGVAKFRNVEASRSVRIVTASLAPIKLGSLISSRKKVEIVNRYGEAALRRVLAEPTLDRMAEEGEVFTRRIGILNKNIGALIRVAKSAGATHASQNMVGQALHAVVPLKRAGAVARALAEHALRPRVDLLEIGRVKAGVTAIAELAYPTETSSLV